MSQNVNNLAAAIVNDPRYSELKNTVYEELVNKDHASVVAVFRLLLEYADGAIDNSFAGSDRTKTVPKIEKGPEIDPDLDDSLTEDETKLRK